MRNVPSDRRATTSVSIAVKSRLRPLAFLTEMLRCEPTRLSVRGRPVKTCTGMWPEPYHIWAYSLYDHERTSQRLDDYLERMRRWLRQRRQAFKQLLAQKDLEVVLSVWMTIEADVASMTLDPVVWRELLEYCHRADVWIDTLDVYGEDDTEAPDAAGSS